MNKKIVKVLAISALTVLGLTACGDIDANPTNYNDPLVSIDGYNKAIYNNTYSVVYDAIRDGNIGSDVLDEVLYRYSNSIFGPFTRNVSPKPAEDEVTLSEAYADSKLVGGDNAKVKKFINAHKAYWTTNDEGKRINDDDKNNKVVVTDANANPARSEIERVQAKFDTIFDRISEKMYEKINSESFKDRSMFSEKKFLESLRSSLENVADPATIAADKMFYGIMVPDVEPQDVFNTTNGFLHIEYYQSDKFNYIEEKLIPDIYRQLLNEQYLLENTYNTLGRSYARKVNIIKLPANTTVSKANDYLAKALVADIFEKPNAVKLSDATNLVNLDSFKNYSKASIEGDTYLTALITTDDSRTAEKKIGLSDIFKKDTVYGTRYYTGTDGGDLLDSYGKIKVDTKTNDSTAEDKFTGSGAYTQETGLVIEGRTLKTKDNTTTGWYVKNGGLTDLPEAIRNRLFSIGVANEVPETEEEANALDRFQKDGTTWKDAAINENEGAYIARIKGANYLKNPNKIEGADDNNDILFYDSSSKAYYVIQVLEAVSSSKLNKEGTNSYFDTRADDVEDIINQVTKVVGTAESYGTLATSYYLEKMNLQYHDDTVYEYFKTNYPDLFD